MPNPRPKPLEMAESEDHKHAIFDKIFRVEWSLSQKPWLHRNGQTTPTGLCAGDGMFRLVSNDMGDGLRAWLEHRAGGVIARYHGREAITLHNFIEKQTAVLATQHLDQLVEKAKP